MASVHLIALRLLRRPDGSDPGLPAFAIDGKGAVIGRAPDCDLVLEDPLRLVSRQHAQILPQGTEGALLRCMSTSVSIGVNGDSVPPGAEALVKIGDRLRIGGFELQVEAPEPPATGPAEPPLQMPQDVAAAPPANPRVEAELAARPVPKVLAGGTRGRLDQWFDLDTVADPLGPGSPLPMPTGLSVPPTGSTVQAGARPAEAPRAEPQPVLKPSAPAAPTAPEMASAPPSSSTADAVLKRAFLQGAGLDTHPQAATVVADAAWMQHLGGLLRAATEGTLSLLRSRAVTKRSIRAEGTQIVQRENNPLKFAPDAAEALVLLLGRQGHPGFLEPVDALRDAHTDLLVHQLAMVAGMRAAVFELISRFGPEAIEAQQGAPKGWARWLPSMHQAALWQRHREQHAHLVANLDDDFEAVFGREFLRAYEAQSRLAAEQRAASDTDR